MITPVSPSEFPSWSNVTSQRDNRTCGEEVHFKYLAYIVTYSVVFPVGLISNFVALFVFLRLTPKKSVTASTVFMTNLAISDVGFSLTLPFRLVYYFQDFQWDFPDWLCRWCVFSFYVNLYTSVLFLTGLSVLRCMAVLLPVLHKNLVNVKRASLVCLAIWVFVACMSTPFLMTGVLKHQGKWRCFDPGSPKSWNRIFTLNYVGVIFGFVIPFFTILVCYSLIIHRLVQRQKDFAGRTNQRRNTRHRSMCLIVVVLSTFLLCFLPYHVARTLHLHARVSGEPCQVVNMWLRFLVISRCTAASNSCINPLLYYFAAENFRLTISRASTRVLVSSVNRGANSSFRHRMSGTGPRRQNYTGSSPNCPCIFNSAGPAKTQEYELSEQQ